MKKLNSPCDLDSAHIALRLSTISLTIANPKPVPSTPSMFRDAETEQELFGILCFHSYPIVDTENVKIMGLFVSYADLNF